MPPETLPQVSGAGQCGADEGWYYDNASAPTKIFLCPTSCTGVQSNPGATVTFAFGCPTVIAG